MTNVIEFPRYKIIAEDPDTGMVAEFWPHQHEGAMRRAGYSPADAERAARRIEGEGYVNVVFAQI